MSELKLRNEKEFSTTIGRVRHPDVGYGTPCFRGQNR